MFVCRKGKCLDISLSANLAGPWQGGSGDDCFFLCMIDTDSNSNQI